MAMVRVQKKERKTICMAMSKCMVLSLLNGQSDHCSLRVHLKTTYLDEIENFLLKVL